MVKEVLEPSEIIVDQPSVDENFSRINPWIRFLARMVDYSIFGIFCSAVSYFIFPSFSFSKYEHFIPIQFLLWVPIEAFLLSKWGYTPGKYFLKTEIRDKRGKILNFNKALHRSFSVWFRGVGMGLPLVNVITMLVAFSKLKAEGITSWDRDEKLKIAHRFVKPSRIAIAASLMIVGVILEFL